MHLINSTRMVAGYTVGMEASGREFLVVVIKGTFRIPTERGASLQLHELQRPLMMSDEFFGEPGKSAPKYEVDFALRKRRCDVLLNGTAYAPGGKAVERMIVGVQVGGWSKSLAVVGDRFWRKVGGVQATAPEPFTSMPVNYDRAFGGVDLRHDDPGQHAAFMPNPSGRGFHKHLKSEWLHESPLPNTEELRNSVSDPGGDYRPMAFGPIGRSWHPRLEYAGTYDQKWLDDVFPFLPADFDEQYYQSAPADQQVPIPLGEQSVVLLNLTPDAQREFQLPHFEAPVQFHPKNSGREDAMASLDTVVFEPDEERVTMTWRATYPLKRSIHEIAKILVGREAAKPRIRLAHGQTTNPTLAE